MRRFLKRLILTAAAVLAAAVVFVSLTLPPRAATLAPAADDRLVWGAYHVHSSLSDGSGTIDAIASAAARAGLQFVIFTDHGDAATFERPSYRSGVLCIHASEINTESGHVVALGLERASPYPLAGEARDVVEDIRRLGGAAIAAHPESPRQSLRWRGPAGLVDGFEWLNVDSEWRARGARAIAAAGLRSLVRAPESLATLFEPPCNYSRWDRGGGPSPLFSLGALDAHARAGADADGPAPGASVRFPSYETMFRTMAQVVRLDAPLSGDPAADSRAVTSGIRARKSYAVMRALADGRAALQFGIANGRASGGVTGGDALEFRLLRNGQTVAQASGSLSAAVADAPGDYRLEVLIGDGVLPWIVSDIVRVPGIPAVPPAGGTRAPTGAAPRGTSVAAWQIEKHAESVAAIETDAGSTVLRYRLGGGAARGQYVALSSPAGTEPIDSIRFTGSAPSPMRVSVQVRVPGGADGQRWRRSVYLDQSPRDIVVELADMQPVGRQTALRPIVARVQSVLIVIDTINARPDSAGHLTIKDARFVHGPAATSVR